MVEVMMNKLICISVLKYYSLRLCFHYHVKYNSM